MNCLCKRISMSVVERSCHQPVGMNGMLENQHHPLARSESIFSHFTSIIGIHCEFIASFDAVRLPLYPHFLTLLMSFFWMDSTFISALTFFILVVLFSSSSYFNSINTMSSLVPSGCNPCPLATPCLGAKLFDPPRPLLV